MDTQMAYGCFNFVKFIYTSFNVSTWENLQYNKRKLIIFTILCVTMLGTYKLIFGLYRSLIYLELRSNDLLKQPILIQQNLIKINDELKVKDDYDSDESDTSEKSEYGNL
jgi:hypothetical protein